MSDEYRHDLERRWHDETWCAIAGSPECGCGCIPVAEEIARAMCDRIDELEAENRRMHEALEQCLGNLKALGAENGWGAEAARAALSQRPVTPAGNIAGTLEVTDVGGSVGSLLSAAARELRRLDRIELELKAENAALRRERDDALRAAWAVRDLATPPISDADVERCIAEAKRAKQEIEDERP